MSLVFYPYRAVGLYCSQVPLSIVQLDSNHFVTVPFEKTFQIFNCDNLRVSRVGPTFPHRIRCVATTKLFNFVASGTDIYVCQINVLSHVLHGHLQKVLHLLVMGTYLISIDSSNVLFVWDYVKGEAISKGQLPSYLHVTSLIHPETYLNKIVLGTVEGPVILWNVHSQKGVFEFPGWGSPVMTIEPSPVLDVVAIALKDGRIIIHNLKVNKTITTFMHDKEDITALAFRTDGHNTLVSGTKLGTLAIWDLEKKKLVMTKPFAHNGPIVSLFFFFNEPLLLSAGSDNSIKIWIFDNADGSARLLRERTGHSNTPLHLSFYDSSLALLSAGGDRTIRIFPTGWAKPNREFSQGNILSLANKTSQSLDSYKLPPVTDIAYSLAKERHWDNVITCHENSPIAYSWRKLKYSLGNHTYTSTEPSGKVPITALAISICGNFGYFGSRTGWIDCYNLQSGQHRGSFYDVSNPHKKSITSIQVDLVNSSLITTSLDGTIKIWSRKDHLLLHTIKLDVAITKAKLSKETNLLAVFSDDHIIRVYQLTTFTLVRKFVGHSSIVTQMVFSHDSRWLICAEGSGIVRVWDLPSGKCLDWFKMPAPVAAMDMSPTGDFLVTSLVGSRGIYLWANANYYGKVFFKALPSQPRLITKPTLAGLADEEEKDNDLPRTDKDESDFATWEALPRQPQLSTALITTSTAPKSKWATLVNLEQIKERNKPKQPPKKPPLAPFFLPTLPGIQPVFVPSPEEEDILGGDKSTQLNTKIIDFAALRPKTRFIIALESADNSQNYNKFVKEVMEMSATALDFEMRSLNTSDNFKEFFMMLRWFQWQLESRNHFDLVQAVMAVFLREQGPLLIRANMELKQLLEKVLSIQKKEWDNIKNLLHSNLCLIDYFTNVKT